MSDIRRPIAVIDSGLGGVSVLAYLIEQMPNEDIVYFGDTLNAPYGSKAQETVKNITLANLRMLIDKYSVKALVIACNTATGAAASACRETFTDLPIIGIEPAIKPAVLKSGKDNPNILVMATPLTLAQEKFTSLAEKYNPNSSIIALPCPGLSELIERNADDSEIRSLLGELFSSIDTESIDSIVLGCTHYPLVSDIIEEFFRDASLYDGGKGTAIQTRHRLEECGLCTDSDKKGNVVFLNSSNDPKFKKLAQNYLKKIKGEI